MTEATQVAVEIGLRATLIMALAGLAYVVLGSRFPRTAQWIGVIACLALLALPVLLAVAPRLDLAPAILKVAPATSTQAFTTQSPRVAASEGEKPWANVRYERSDPRLFVPAVGIYVIGLLVVMTRLARSWSKVRMIERGCADLPGGRARAAAKSVSAPGSLRIVTHPRCRSPLTLGILSPKILIPEGTTRWPPEKLSASMAHEVAHLRNHDPLWNFVAYLAAAVYWFHPGVWVLRRQIRDLAERASDDEAIRKLGDSRKYARNLLEFAIEATARPDPLAVSLTHPIAQSSMSRRIQRILDGPGGEGPSPRRRVTRFALATGILFVGIAAIVKIGDFAAAGPLEESSLGRPLVSALGSGNPQARAEALFRLSRWQGRESQVLPLLLAHLGDDAPIGSMPQWDFVTEGWAPARSTLRSASPGEVAALGLASMGHRAADALSASLADPNPVARRNAAWALGELRHPRRISRREAHTLASRLRDPDPTVRAAAAWAIGDIALVRYLPEIRSMLRSETDGDARAEALDTLRALEAGVSLESFRTAHDRS